MTKIKVTSDNVSHHRVMAATVTRANSLQLQPKDMVMTKALKRLSIAMATAVLLVASMTGALAQVPTDPHHPQGETEDNAPPPQAEPAPPGQGMEGMMGGGQTPMMEMMREMHEKMMGGDMAMLPKGDTGPSSQAFNGITAKMHQDMAITFTGNVDVDFVKEMIPHHQAAVDMAKTLLAFGKDPEIRSVAGEILKTQEAEIAWMKDWLKKQGQ